VDAALQPDVSRIREKLRVIRDRAEEAGLLNKDAGSELPPTSPAPLAAPSFHPPTPLPIPPAPTAPAFTSFQFATPLPFAAAAPGTAPALASPSSPLFKPFVPPSSPVPVPVPPPEATPAPNTLEPAPSGDTSSWAAPERTTIVERLDEFARWSSRLTTSEELFMLDDHGSLIWGSPTSDGLLVCAKLAMNASMRSQSPTLAKPAASMTVQVSPGKELQLISCATRHGSVTLALVNPREVPAHDLRQALIEAVNA
jgi:hypothetical protein